MTGLRIGNTRAWYIPGTSGGLLADTGYAGTLPLLYGAMKENGLRLGDIAYVMATHYHPDHAGLVGELADKGVKLLLIDVQREHVRFPDRIFARDGIPYVPVPEEKAEVISAGESRSFLGRLGIAGEIVRTPSHSRDSVSLVTDAGDAVVGDLEPFEYLGAYGENEALEEDWKRILALHPKRILFAHAPERILPGRDRD